MLLCLSARARMPHATSERADVAAEMNQPVSASGRRVLARPQIADSSIFFSRGLSFTFYCCAERRGIVDAAQYTTLHPAGGMSPSPISSVTVGCVNLCWMPS